MNKLFRIDVKFYSRNATHPYPQGAMKIFEPQYFTENHYPEIFKFSCLPQRNVLMKLSNKFQFLLQPRRDKKTLSLHSSPLDTAAIFSNPVAYLKGPFCFTNWIPHFAFFIANK